MKWTYSQHEIFMATVFGSDNQLRHVWATECVRLYGASAEILFLAFSCVFDARAAERNQTLVNFPYNLKGSHSLFRIPLFFVMLNYFMTNELAENWLEITIDSSFEE